MKNINQIRARNAFNSVGKIKGGVNGGEVVKKIPPIIMNNGLLSALAFAHENDGWKSVFVEAEKHLRDDDIDLLPSNEPLLQYLTEKADSQALKLITNEILAWLEFLRRFTSKDDA